MIAKAGFLQRRSISTPGVIVPRGDSLPTRHPSSEACALGGKEVSNFVENVRVLQESMKPAFKDERPLESLIDALQKPKCFQTSYSGCD